MVAMVAAMPFDAGCTCNNRLPPNPVPGPDGPPGLPEWFPEKPWSAEDGESQVMIEGKIVYDVDRATIRPESEPVLTKLLQFLQEHPEVTRLRVEGHTDSTAGEEYNQDLSARRALSVCNWLVDRGVDHNRLIAVGFGESRPLAPNELVEGRQENRRTEFHVAEVEGAPFLGKDPTNGGLALEVLSAEERQRQNEPPPVTQPKLPPFNPTGNEIKAVTSTAAQEGTETAPPDDGG